ncbi:MAG TPA: NADPH-dependent assimilatory sulfite reductase hemoprotein subunit [Candidatus Limnocylindria bacterium]|nr:NADPH-dependent assimilatory sulfite reductase hemoprotein subunit [Candidatus Limnocylindria bacterium]
MSKVDVEKVKAESRGLRGSIAAEIGEETPRFSEEAASLLKFHGTYQQEDRDARKTAREHGGEKDYQFMIRVRATAGRIPARLWSAIDELVDAHGNGTIRVTTRQALQIHGVRKRDLKTVIGDVVAHLGSTLATCGDVVRNVCAPAWPYEDAGYAATRQAAQAIARAFAPRTGGYLEIWQDGEIAHSEGAVDEPVYGATYLPRKFKIAVTVPGDNSVDLYTNDLGIVAIVRDGKVVSYNLAVGGGLGMTHNKAATFPRLADHLGSIPPERLLDAVRAVVVVQRDHGDRTDRRHARLKYLIADRGLDWFRAEVEREAGFRLEPWREIAPWEDVPRYGWHAQGDGNWFYGLHVQSGRIRDTADARLKSALRAIADRFGYEFIATLGQQLLIAGVPTDGRAEIDAILREHGVVAPEDVTPLRKRAMACPALPTCGLALAESERVIPALLDDVEAALAQAGLDGQAITIRMTGCPNGCARPFLAEIGLVGKSADRYQVYLGGDPASTRLAKLWRDGVRLAEVAPLLAPLFTAYRAQRAEGESFGDWTLREVLEEVPA